MSPIARLFARATAQSLSIRKARPFPIAIVTACAAISALVAVPANAQNLVTNGNFSAGNTGFSSQYTLGGIGSPGTYVIGTNPNTVARWAGYGDHTSGTGNMMIVNGSTSAGLLIWSQTISVNPNTNHFFSVWVANATFSPLANISLIVNGVPVASVATPASTGIWRQGTGVWNSNNDTSAVLSLVNLQTAFGGNDFTIDDIAFSSVAVVPEPGTFCLLGFALVPVGVGLIRRRK